jgi:TatD DNase family protein
MKFIDIGANLTHESFAIDYSEVLEDAVAKAVIHIIITGTDLASSEAAINLAAKNPSLLSSTVGFHPHIAKNVQEKEIEKAAILIKNEKVAAIGEAGLDYNRNYSPKHDQLRVFEQQLEFAKTLKKPLFLHQRDAHSDFFQLLKRYRPNIVGGVVHCFTDSHRALLDYLDLGMYIGITGWICDERRGKNLQEIVHKIPLDRLLIETDSPYLLPRTISPKPKSRRNEPKYLIEVAKCIAEHTPFELDEITEKTTENAIKLFNLSI